jgi:hypothetical protein
VDSAPEFHDVDPGAVYAAHLTPGGVRFIARVLEAHQPRDEFTKAWLVFEECCKAHLWEQA